MRLKKGFTLAEVLIVLMVIGAIATLTVPSLMKGVKESQMKTAYKKALNSVINIAAMEYTTGALPGKTAGQLTFFNSLNSNLSVKEYVSQTNTANSARPKPDKYVTTPGTDGSDWIVTEDGLAYMVETQGTVDCNAKKDINEASSLADAKKAACVTVVVDTDGLSNGVNTTEETYLDAGTTPVPKLTNDRYYIFIGNDGATAGSKTYSITGRIAADLK